MSTESRKRLRQWLWPFGQQDPERLRREEELRAAFLRRLLLVSTLVTAGYLVLGSFGFGASRLFPYDAIEMLAAIGLSAWLLARRRIALATIWLLVIMSHPVSFQVATHGVRSAAGTLILLTIVICGLLVGRSLLVLWAIICSEIMLWLAWTESRNANGVSLTELLPAVLGWWTLFGITAWLIGLFSIHLERLLQVTRRQADTRSRLLEVLLRAPDAQKIMAPVVEVIRNDLQAAWVSLWRWDAAAGLLHCLATVPASAKPEVVPGDAWATWAQIAVSRTPLSVRGAEAIEQQVGPLLPQAGEMAEVLLVPLSVADACTGVLVIGFAQLDRDPEERQAVAQDAGQLASLCMEMIRLAASDRQAAVLAERNRLAHDIHDTLAQGFTGVLLQIAAADEMLGKDDALARRHLETARGLAKNCLDEARRSVHALRPGALDRSGLPESLAEIARQLDGDGKIPIRVEVTGARYRLPPDIESDLLRIGQEAMTNAVRHAAPGEVAVRVTYTAGRVRLSVEDRGGTAAVMPMPASPGLGLPGMRARAQRMGGTLQVDSGSGKGTCVSVEVAV